MVRPPELRPLRLAVTILLGLVLAVLLVWPQGFGVQRGLVFSQLIAFRGVMAIALLVGAVIFAVIAGRKKVWGIAAGLAIVFGIAGIADGAILVGRGAALSDAEGDLTVVAWNTLGGATAPSSVARLVLEVEADIVSLPEMDERAAAEVALLVAAEGRPMFAHTLHGETGYSDIPTSVLIAEHLGEYRVDDSAGSTPEFPSAVLRPTDGSGPVVIAAHPYPPLPERMDVWRDGLQWVADQCDDPNVIVAGDLNATVDHMSGLGTRGGHLGACTDAAVAVGAAAVGTWPASAPTWLASPIDHVLTGSAWIARGVASFEGAGSDHRPIVAVLDAQ